MRNISPQPFLQSFFPGHGGSPVENTMHGYKTYHIERITTMRLKKTVSEKIERIVWCYSTQNRSINELV